MWYNYFVSTWVLIPFLFFVKKKSFLYNIGENKIGEKNMRYNYRPKFVCAQLISFDLNDDIVTNISFTGGCNGNLKAISKLLEGQSVEYIEKKLSGNTCGMRDTSCADQLAKAVREAYDSSHK